MWKVNILFCLVVLSSSYTNGQIENLIGLPVEYDNQLDRIWDSNNDDIWIKEEHPDIYQDSPTKSLQILCEKYDLEWNNRIIDCENIKIVPKSLKVYEHTIKKRDAEEEMEGSGEDPPSEQDSPKETPNSSFKFHSLGAAPEDVPAASENETKPEASAPEPDTQEVLKETEVQEEGETEVKAITPESEEPKLVESELPKEPETSEGKFEAPKEPEPAKDEIVPEANAPSDNAETTSKPVAPLLGAVPSSENTEGPKSEEPKKENSDNVELNETLEKGKESGAKKGGRAETQEDLNSQQSGNALVDSGGNMKETEEGLGKMKPNQSLRAGAIPEEPKSGESSEKSGRKDTSLLIGFFVAVLVVGAAAFAYNYIKKRKTRNASRSPPNGTVKIDDPEQGREMKPLMMTVEQRNAEVKVDK